MATYTKPYLSGLRLNLHEFVGPTQRRNSAGEVVQMLGKQKPNLSVDIDLYLTKTKNVGRQNYTFTDKPTPAVLNSHDGLPDYSAIVSPQLIATLETQFGTVIDANLPEYSIEDPAVKAVGVAVHPRINAIQASLPPEESKASERYIAFVVGLYEDDKFTRQIIDADFVVIFAEDAYLARSLGVRVDDLNPAALAQIRSDNTCYPLRDFLATPAVAQSIGAIGQSVFETLIARVNQWKHMDLEELMEDFAEAFGEMAGAAA